MTYHPGAIETTLASGVGNDPSLIADLSNMLVDSVEDTIATMANATDINSWRMSAWRLRGLAASFGAVRLITLAIEAAGAQAGDPVVIGKLKHIVARP